MKRLQAPFAGLILLFTITTGCRKIIDDTVISTESEIASVSSSAITTKYIKVNFYGGSNSYTNSEWNNWNTNNSTSGTWRYSDGSNSSVTAVITQNGVSDNGTSYSTDLAPSEVTRYASYSTSNRTLTISGLDDAKSYGLELFASRKGTSNNSTRFIIGNNSVDVKTDNNTNTKAIFTSLVPSYGKIVININKLNTYTYINGIVLSETETEGTIETLPPVETVSKYVKVSIFGGSNTYNNTEWNNWNSSSTSASFKYSDGSLSSVSASITQNSVSDNGSTYGSGMAPSEVLRYASYSTSTRNLIINGLDNQKTYNLELYASRKGNSNNSTRFTIGSSKIEISTDNNLTNKASFTTLVPTDGKIIVNIERLNTYNYLNGFVLSENGTDISDPDPDPAPAPPPPPTAPGCNNDAPVTYTLQPSDNEIYIPDGSKRGWKGGDTLRIPAGSYSLIHIGNFKGDSCRPIVIINYGGQVRVDKMRFVNNAAYFKLTGTGHSAYTYGFKASSSANAGIATDYAHHVEISNVEVTGTGVGFYLKKQPDASDPLSVYPNYTLSNYYIHHNYIHDVHGEGMYIGHTYSNADPYNGNMIPIRMDKVEIAYNIIDGTDWDGIQLSNARTGAKIHHNTITNFGRINMGSQQAGIILGGNTNGDIYENIVKNGTGNGIEAYGYGLIKIYNNLVENAGADGTASGQESIFCNDFISTVENNPKQQIQCFNNTIRNPRPKGAIRVGAYNFNSLASSLTNNKIYLPNASADWLRWHVVTNAPGSIISGNILLLQ